MTTISPTEKGFEHNEKPFFDIVLYLGDGKEDFSVFRKFGKNNSQKPQSRQTLTADKTIARAPTLKMFKSTYNGEPYRVLFQK